MPIAAVNASSQEQGIWNEETLRQFNQINLTALIKIVSRLKNKTCIPLIQNTRFGRTNITILLSFENDPEKWIAKFPLMGGRGGTADDDLLEEHIDSMVATMKYVSERTSIPVPRVHHWESSCLNEFGRPYVIMDSVAEKTLLGLERSGVDMDDILERLSSFVDQWARYHAELTTIQFAKIGSLLPNGQVGQLCTSAHLHFSTLLNGDNFRGPFQSVAEYLLTLSEYKCRSLATSAIGHSYRTFLQGKILESMMPFFVDHGYANGPFVLKHQNLDVENIFVEEDGKDGFRIMGVVGWEFSCVVPLQSQMCLPQSLIVDGKSVEKKEKGNTSTWRIKFAEKYRDEYRNCYLRHLQKLKPKYPAYLLDSGHWFAKFEKAISIGSAEDCFTRLWRHVYSTRVPWQEVILQLESSDWGLAMAERFASDEAVYDDDGKNTIVVSHSRPQTRATFRPCWKPKVRWRMRIVNNLRWGWWRFEQCLLCQFGEKRVAVLMRSKRRTTISEIVDCGGSIRSKEQGSGAVKEL